MRRIVAVTLVFAACAGAPPAPERAASRAPARAAQEAPLVSPAARTPIASSPGESLPEALPDAETSGKPAKKSPPGDGAPECPAGMQLVSGDYCSEVEHHCLRSWHDKANDKIVCEEFEPRSKCVGGRTPKRFCIDTYTWPNQRGARPEVMNRFHQAQLKCAAVGKRLCTESEWTMACEGPELLPFPYGYVRDTNKCHGDMAWDSPDMKKVAARDPQELARLWKGVRNGSQPECVSPYGVADLPGNVDEVVASESFDQPGFRGRYDSIHTGGPWYKGVRNQCRPKIYTHDEGFYYYFLGFRCCAEADGKPTEPLTPKQQKQKWTLARVEKSAGFTLTQVKQALEAPEQHCRCRDKDILCKTLCGTLLGPTAKDYK